MYVTAVNSNDRGDIVILSVDLSSRSMPVKQIVTVSLLDQSLLRYNNRQDTNDVKSLPR